MNKTIKIAFDVDGTLIALGGVGLDKPRYHVIALYHIFERLGCQMYIWSGSGVDYAARWGNKLGLNGTVVPKGSFEPEVAIDDMPFSEVTLGKINIQV